MIPQTNDVTYTYLSETLPNNGVLKGYDNKDETNKTINFDVSSLGKDDFLKLLLAQMKHQDPLNPASNTEFVSQLAQFSSLEQMTQMNAGLEKSLENNSLMAEAVNNAMLINYFGKTVTAESDSFVYNGSDTVKLQFTSDSAILSGTLEVLNENGDTIRSIPLEELSRGINTVGWDGITSLGIKAAEGQYSYKINAYDFLGNSIEVSQMFSGVVDGIAYRDGIAHLNISGVMIPFNSVRQVTEE